MIIFDLLVAETRHIRKKLINVYCFEFTMHKISITVKIYNNIVFVLLNVVEVYRGCPEFFKNHVDDAVPL